MGCLQPLLVAVVAVEFTIVLRFEVVKDAKHLADRLRWVDGAFPVWVDLHEACSLLLDLSHRLGRC